MAQTAVAFKRTPSGGSAEWWDGSVWVTSETFSAQISPEEVVFAAGTWAAGTYTWSIATKDSAGAAGPYSTARTVTFEVDPASRFVGWGVPI